MIFNWVLKNGMARCKCPAITARSFYMAVTLSSITASARINMTYNVSIIGKPMTSFCRGKIALLQTCHFTAYMLWSHYGCQTLILGVVALLHSGYECEIKGGSLTKFAMKIHRLFPFRTTIGVQIWHSPTYSSVQCLLMLLACTKNQNKSRDRLLSKLTNTIKSF